MARGKEIYITPSEAWAIEHAWSMVEDLTTTNLDDPEYWEAIESALNTLRRKVYRIDFNHVEEKYKYDGGKCD